MSNPVRLPILLALEDRPRSVADLARDTGWSRLVDALDGIAATCRDPASA
ncbi:MAG TPA: ArsR family transcriptional regulator [Baekduia sp.]|nr:ArsR family transcriptional regulator [Baekduia sp.]